MKKTIYLSAIISILLFNVQTLQAQAWMVGQPVNQSISTITMPGWGCYPEPDHHFIFPVSPIAGVEYAMIITAVSPADSVEITPTGIVQAGDTIWITEAIDRDVLFLAGAGGNLELDFRAIGTPTNAGDATPCDRSELWLSDLLLCDEGLSPVLNYDCVVEISNNTEELEPASIQFQFPTLANSQQLSIQTEHKTQGIRVINLQGQHLLQSNTTVVDCSSLVNGVYIGAVQLANGQIMSRKFLISQ